MIRRVAVVALLALASIVSAAEPLRAREWFVRAGSEGGDGSQAKPFGDPFDQATEWLRLALNPFDGQAGTAMPAQPASAKRKRTRAVLSARTTAQAQAAKKTSSVYQPVTPAKLAAVRTNCRCRNLWNQCPS